MARMSKAPSTGSFSHSGGRNYSWRKQGIISCHQLPEELSSEEAWAGNYEACSPCVFVLHLSLNWSCRGPCPKQITVGLVLLPPPHFLFCFFIADSAQHQYTPSLYTLRNTNPRLLLAKIFLFVNNIVTGPKDRSGAPACSFLKFPGQAQGGKLLGVG